MSYESVITLTITATTPAASTALTTLKNIAIRREPYVFDLEGLYTNPLDNTPVDIAIGMNNPFELSRSNKLNFEAWGVTEPSLSKEIENSDKKYCVKFLVNYCPPFQAFIKISLDYPELTFGIYFRGVEDGYYGRVAYRNGEHAIGGPSITMRMTSCFRRSRLVKPRKTCPKAMIRLIPTTTETPFRNTSQQGRDRTTVC